ncbi:unnamed protein product [Cylicocyclus nassatus]|uniref:Dedicator of cytokinesis C/D N-terminal domain-containing protein n=1 Tax=Cylicocyclus nassatus TaxID=53992 RepID=A0AA36GGW8_CYLNA|nr:unnamed protein product [Cylicocyclus nassatus]
MQFCSYSDHGSATAYEFLLEYCDVRNTIRREYVLPDFCRLSPENLRDPLQTAKSSQLKDAVYAAELSLLDVVDPCDIEEALAQRRTSALYDISSTTASPRNKEVSIKYTRRAVNLIDICRVSEFSADDVEVGIVSREWPTVDPPVPTETKDLKIEPFLRDIIASFTDQFSLVQRRYQRYGSADAYVRMLIERPIIVRSTTQALSVVGDQYPYIPLMSQNQKSVPNCCWCKSQEKISMLAVPKTPSWWQPLVIRRCSCLWSSHCWHSYGSQQVQFNLQGVNAANSRYAMDYFFYQVSLPS